MSPFDDNDDLGPLGPFSWFSLGAVCGLFAAIAAHHFLGL